MNELTHAVDRLVVEVESPSGRRTVSLPARARISDLVPGLVDLCEGRSDAAGWELAPKGEPRLPGEMTLGESGLFPGAVLVLIQTSRQRDAEPDGPGWAARLPLVADRIRGALRPPAEPKSIDR